MRHETCLWVYDLEGVSSADMTRCHGCERPSGKETKLKKCAGCSVAVYCNTYCQKKAWPSHKEFCRSKHAQPKTTIAVDEYHELRNAPPLPRSFTVRVDFPTAMAVASDWETFSEYHAWAVSTIAGAAAWLGASRNSMSQTPFRLDDFLLQLYVVPINRPNQHPANSWLMRCLRLSSLARETGEDKGLADTLKLHTEAFATAHARSRAIYGARYAGSITVVHRLGVDNLVQPAQRPLYVWHQPARLLDQATQDAVQDFLQLLQAFVSDGIILKPTSATVVPGRLVQVQKKMKTTWEWTPLSSEQAERLQKSAVPHPKTRMSFAQLGLLYASL